MSEPCKCCGRVELDENKIFNHLNTRRYYDKNDNEIEPGYKTISSISKSLNEKFGQPANGLVPDECIGVCEECNALFNSDEMKPDGKWAHVCKMKKYKEEHRCESYIKKFGQKPVPSMESIKETMITHGGNDIPEWLLNSLAQAIIDLLEGKEKQ